MNLAPGIYHNIGAARYHADDLCDVPTLSSSIAKTLLSATPRHAWTEHPRLNPRFEATSEKKFALGSVVHEMLLGKGGGFAVLDFADYRNKAAKEERDNAVALGRTPILSSQHEAAVKVACSVLESIREIPGAASLVNSADGRLDCAAETVVIWRDMGGPLCRAMIDAWGPIETEIWDIKTVGVGLSDGALRRQIENLGYDLSAGFYLRGLESLRPNLSGRFRWRWIFVEAEAPFEVRVVEPDGEMLEIGRRKAAVAIAKWQHCLSTGAWEGYPREVTRLAPSPWGPQQWLEREMIDPDARKAIFDNVTVVYPVEHVMHGG